MCPPGLLQPPPPCQLPPSRISFWSWPGTPHVLKRLMAERAVESHLPHGCGQASCRCHTLDESPPIWGHVWGLVSHSAWLPPPWWATWELWWTPAPPGWGEAVLFDSKATSRLVTDMWGDGDGSSRGQCPKVPQVQSPQSQVLAPLCWSLQPGTLGPDSWICLALVPLTERPRWLGGTPTGDPSIHGVSWTGAGLASGSSGALPVLQLISPDRVPHGHGSAQRG